MTIQRSAFNPEEGEPTGVARAAIVSPPDLLHGGGAAAGAAACFLRGMPVARRRTDTQARKTHSGAKKEGLAGIRARSITIQLSAALP